MPVSGEVSRDERARIMEACKARLGQWLEDNPLDVRSFVEFEEDGADGDEPRIGIEWAVVVGRCGDEGRWVWSARWRAWLATMRAMDLRDRSARLDAAIANGECAGAGVVDIDSYR